MYGRVLLLLFATGFVEWASVASESGDHPNIVIFVSDDQGYHDLGCYGNSSIRTPNLDRLARGGVRLTDFYVTWPACTPSRASLLTGRYPQRNGMYDMVRNEAPDYGYKYTPAEYEVTFERIGGLDTREVLLPELLKRAGYVSGIFGKWDLGSLQRYLPLARGFDDFYGFVNTGIDYFTHERYGVPSMYRNNQPTVEDKGTYCTELFEREAVRFLEANRQRPFLLYLPFNAPHSASNLDPAIRSGAQGTDKYKRMYPELARQAKLVDGKRYGQPAKVNNKEGRRLEYVAAVTQMDATIGRVLDLLDEYGLADNTIVLFCSDNGGGGNADNWPLRGGKGRMFEGGIRVPCIVRYPPRLPANQVCPEFLTSLEILPTLLKLAGVPRPQGVTFDGFDMLAVLSGERESPRDFMVWKRKDDVALRLGDWKWVHSARGGGLFSLKDDVGENRDLSTEHPDKLAMIKSRFAEWEQEMAAAEPRGPFRDF